MDGKVEKSINMGIVSSKRPSVRWAGVGIGIGIGVGIGVHDVMVSVLPMELVSNFTSSP